MATNALAPAKPAPVRSIALRKVAGRAGQVALSEKHTMTAVAAGAALGLVKRNNVPIPYIEAIGLPGTVGLAVWAVGRFTGNQMAQHAASGLLAIAAYELAAGKAGGVAGDETIMGEI